MKKILYIYPINTSFVTSDLQVLSKHYAVKPFSFAVKKKIYTPLAFLQQLFFLLIHLPSSSFIVTQFSGYHSFLPSVLCKVFNQKHFIIVHGTECNNFPEYQYGYLIRPLLFWFSQKSLALASRILPVSEALIEQDYTYTETRHRKQGLHAFYSEVVTPMEVIHNGVAPGRFTMLPNISRTKNSFVTVATGLGDQNRRGIKGLDLVCELAEKLPESTFTFVGGTIPTHLNLPKNILVIPSVPNEELQLIYNQHQFYIQLSVSEGFGIAVVEAMMCGCIPIVSTAGILPKIIGGYGYILENKNLDLLQSLVETACTDSNQIPLEEMSAYATNAFSLEKRERTILDCFNSV